MVELAEALHEGVIVLFPVTCRVTPGIHDGRDQPRPVTIGCIETCGLRRSQVHRHMRPSQRRIPGRCEPRRTGAASQTIGRFAPHPGPPRGGEHRARFGEIADKGSLPRGRPSVAARAHGDGVERRNAATGLRLGSERERGPGLHPVGWSKFWACRKMVLEVAGWRGSTRPPDNRRLVGEVHRRQRCYTNLYEYCWERFSWRRVRYNIQAGVKWRKMIYRIRERSAFNRQKYP